MNVTTRYTVEGHEHARSTKDMAPETPRSTYDPRHGWAVEIPPTSREAYISGLDALNLPRTDTDQSSGDWHETATWWSPTYLDGNDRPHRVQRWGPKGEIEATPITPTLRDARSALAVIEHPGTTQSKPVFAATMAQAVVDLAWEALSQGSEGPGRREIVGWLGDHDEERARDMAIQVEAAIADEKQRASWQVWREESLEGEDPFYDTHAIHTHKRQGAPQVKIVLRTNPGPR